MSQSAEPTADCVFSSAFAVDSFGGVAQLSTLGCSHILHFMKTPQTELARRYRLAMIVTTVSGGFLLLLGVGGNVMELPAFHGILPWALSMSGSSLIGVGSTFHRRLLNL